MLWYQSTLLTEIVNLTPLIILLDTEYTVAE